MTEDQMISLLGNLDDDLIEKELDFLMGPVECDVESINRKAHQKLKKYNRKSKWRKRLPYAAAVCLCLIGINVVYADEISQALKSFFNKTPVYSTMVDGRAYYLESSLVLDDNLSIDSLLVSEGNVEMVCTSKLEPNILGAMTIIPKDNPNAQYNIGVYMKGNNENQYHFIFADCAEHNFKIKPFKDFDLLVGGKTYPITLSEAKSFDSTQNLTVSQAANQVDLVTVGANIIEKDGKQAVQLIASFKNNGIKLTAFGQPVETTFKSVFKNLGKDGQVGSSTGYETKDIYATDETGGKHKLTVPADAKARPITTFETDANKGSQLTIDLPALVATYEESVCNIRLDIPHDGEVILNQDVDLVAQKAIIKSIKRLSPTSAQLTLQLNSGADQYVSVSSFCMESDDVKKISAEFSGDQAIVNLEFDKDASACNLAISYPKFVVNGNWTINMK